MRNNNIIITIDYETWQPIPEGKAIEWKKDLIDNTYALAEVCEKVGAKLTIMAEMCEYIWLEENEPRIANMVEKQLQELVKKGHDVQLHIHPNWMPDTGVLYNDGEWIWDEEQYSCDNYKGDLTELIKVCKERLESIIQPVKNDYHCIAFRAGGYRVQPFSRIYDALVENHIYIDSSVYKGGFSKERGVDFRKCHSNTRPYRVDKFDPQIEGKNSEIIEFPITTFESNSRWFIDNDEADEFGKRFIYASRTFFNYNNNVFTAIGHSKADRDYKMLEEQLMMIKNYPGVVFSTFSECYNVVEDFLDDCICKNTIREVKEIMDYLYESIIPYDDAGWTHEEVLSEGRALCAGYASVLGLVLRQYGYNPLWVTAYAENMPNGVGDRKEDTHELIECKIDNIEYLLDPTTDKVSRGKFEDFVFSPQRAKERIKPDGRYIDRNYRYYDTEFFFLRVKYWKTRKYPYVVNRWDSMLHKVIKLMYNEIVFRCGDKIKHKIKKQTY